MSTSWSPRTGTIRVAPTKVTTAPAVKRTRNPRTDVVGAAGGRGIPRSAHAALAPTVMSQVTFHAKGAVTALPVTIAVPSARTKTAREPAITQRSGNPLSF